jgi:hypothetical protein
LASEVLWSLVNTFVRVSALVLILKLFGINARVRYASFVLMCFSTMYGVAATMTVLLICRPVRASWDVNIQGTCGNQIATYVGLELIGLALDIGILILPVWGIWGIRMSFRAKLQAILILSTGAWYVTTNLCCPQLQ